LPKVRVEPRNFGLLPTAGTVHQLQRPSHEVMQHFGVELEAAAA
jgi:hypothetical protein